MFTSVYGCMMPKHSKNLHFSLDTGLGVYRSVWMARYLQKGVTIVQFVCGTSQQAHPKQHSQQTSSRLIAYRPVQMAKCSQGVQTEQFFVGY